MNNDRARIGGILAATCQLLLVPCLAHSQTLETETARLLPRRAVEVGGAYETQSGGGGPERAVPFIVLFGLTDRIEVAIEPVPYTSIQPTGAQKVHGVGDLEGTFSIRFRDETAVVPALAFAAEVKLPTAKNALIGTGRADYTGWAIASKRYGRVDTHANVAYTFTGSPPGVKLSNTWTGALAAEFLAGNGFQFFGETMATTAAAAEGGDTPLTTGTGAPTIPPEAAGSVLFGSLGVGRYITPAALLFTSVTYDNTKATLLRVGMTLRLR